MDWRTELDLERALRNLRNLAKGDWYRDPWGWPEYQYILDSSGEPVWRYLDSQPTARSASRIDVPKENFGVRPAVQLDITEHVAYQSLVDYVSTDILGEMRPDVFGWRLPSGKVASPGDYSRNDFQWLAYRTRLSELAGQYQYGLKTDIASFFSSIPAQGLVDELAGRTGKIAAVDRLATMISGWQRSTEGRSGLPQRSSASSVLANMYLMAIDELLADLTKPTSIDFGSRQRQASFTRWMDDVWIFDDEQSALRGAQVSLQGELRGMGLLLNSGKTQLHEGDAMRVTVRKAQASAVDDALSDEGNAVPLEEMIDEILDGPEVADGTRVKFVTTRMRRWRVSHRIDDLLAASGRFPHAADSLSRLFRAQLRTGQVQEWYLDYLAGPWKYFEWATAQFGTAIPSSPRPRRATRVAFEDQLDHGAKSLPGLALAAQRVASWDPQSARGLLQHRASQEADPLLVRVLALSALSAGERPATLRRWLRPFREGQLTVQMLSARSFAPLPITRDYR